MFSSRSVWAIWRSIFCGGTLISISKNNCFKFFLESKNSCVVSSQRVFSLSVTFAYPYQGKSTNCHVLLIKKKLNNLVFHGIFEAFAKFFLWVNPLISEDFPTFDLQKNANSGYWETGHWERFAALVINSAVLICMFKKEIKVWIFRGRFNKLFLQYRF